MNFIKIGSRYVNLDNVESILEAEGYRPSDTKYEHYDPCLYVAFVGSDDYAFKLFDEEMDALKQWLDRVAVNVTELRVANKV